MDYKKSYMILLLCLWGGGIVTFVGLGLGTKFLLFGDTITGMGIVTMLGGFGQALVFYKCPSCGRQLNIRERKPNHCPGCGCKLDLM